MTSRHVRGAYYTGFIGLSFAAASFQRIDGRFQFHQIVNLYRMNILSIFKDIRDKISS
jgi:hypothetical protein